MTTIETIYRMSVGHSYEAAASGGSKLLSAVDWLERVLEKRRSRKALLEMSDEQLKDIGLSRSDAHGEAVRSFWD
jgi:uncharacterized protein YjiS (DUF1127 family)